MNETTKMVEKGHSKAVIKAGVLVAFIMAAILLVRFTSIKGYLTPEALGHLVDAAGVWAPLLYIVLYSAGVCLLLPGTILTGLGGEVD